MPNFISKPLWSATSGLTLQLLFAGKFRVLVRVEHTFEFWTSVTNTRKTLLFWDKILRKYCFNLIPHPLPLYPRFASEYKEPSLKTDSQSTRTCTKVDAIPINTHWLVSRNAGSAGTTVELNAEKLKSGKAVELNRHSPLLTVECKSALSHQTGGGGAAEWRAIIAPLHPKRTFWIT